MYVSFTSLHVHMDVVPIVARGDVISSKSQIAGGCESSNTREELGIKLRSSVGAIHILKC